jgi:predicted transcriptional regulator
MAKKLTAVRLDEAQHARLEKIAERDERSVAFLIRRAVNEYLDRTDPKPKK